MYFTWNFNYTVYPNIFTENEQVKDAAVSSCHLPTQNISLLATMILYITLHQSAWSQNIQNFKISGQPPLLMQTTKQFFPMRHMNWRWSSVGPPEFYHFIISHINFITEWEGKQPHALALHIRAEVSILYSVMNFQTVELLNTKRGTSAFPLWHVSLLLVRHKTRASELTKTAQAAIMHM